MKKILNDHLKELLSKSDMEFNTKLEDALQAREVNDYLFENINFHSIYMLNNTFTNCKFIDNDLYGCVLNGSIFVNCQFLNSSLRKTELQLINFENCVFENCDLSRAQILNSKVNSTDFKSCNFTGIHIFDSELRNVLLSNWTEDMVIFGNNKEENVARLL
jgi:uncharacterized protein YjbI with pentapeptide repeats